MKSKIYITLLFISSLLVSCFEDESNTAFILQSPITIDLNGGPETYIIKQYSHLRIAPLVFKEGTDDAHLSFKWEIIGDNLREEIGNGMVLDANILVPQSTYPYTILYTVTDNETGISTNQTWELTVNGIFSDGIIVADTRDEGQTTDLSIIMGYNFSSNGDYTNDLKNDVRINNICSQYTGGAIAGKVYAIQNANYSDKNYGTTRFLTLLTDNGVIRLNPDTYKETDRNNSIFTIAPETDNFKAQSIQYHRVIRTEYMSLDGQIYSRPLAQGNKHWGYKLYPGGINADYNVSQFALFDATELYTIAGYAFDDKHKRFLQINRDGESLMALKDGTWFFNPNNVGENKKCIHMEENGDDPYIMYALMKDDENADERYEIYGLYGEEESPRGNNLQSGRYNVTSAEEIDQAENFTISPFEPETMYYATKNTVYYLYFPEEWSEPVYTTEGNEEITSIGYWKADQGMCKFNVWGMWDEEAESMGTLFVITTWDPIAKEGRLRCIPFNFYDGVLDPSAATVYEGFGRILCWGVQQQ